MLTLTACFHDHDDVTESALTHVIQIWKKNTKYLTDTIVTMQVAVDPVHADILVNHRGISILRAPRDAAFYKFVYWFSYCLPLILSIWMVFNYHRYGLYQWIMRLLVNVARLKWLHLNVAIFVEIDGWERKIQLLVEMPAVPANARRSTVVWSPPGPNLETLTRIGGDISRVGTPNWLFL